MWDTRKGFSLGRGWGRGDFEFRFGVGSIKDSFLEEVIFRLGFDS